MISISRLSASLPIIGIGHLTTGISRLSALANYLAPVIGWLIISQSIIGAPLDFVK